MLQFFGGMNPYVWILIIVVSILIIAALLYWSVTLWFAGNKGKKKPGNGRLYEIIADAGFSYNPEQDIFYSNLNPWQRKMGYCRLYDEALTPLNMMVDCEPICFEYGGKRWMIGFWKGQYGMNSGAEIGIYTTKGPDLNIHGFFNGTFYNCASNSEMLYMSYSLVKNDEILITRRAKHWWLSGFKLGEFSEPSELTLYLTVALKSKPMCNAFIKGLNNAGYKTEEIFIDGNEVSLVFERPRTPQPNTRVPENDRLIQRKNKLLCDKYQEITKGYDNFPDKMNAIREQTPEIFDALLNIGKTKPMFAAYNKLKKYL